MVASTRLHQTKRINTSKTSMLQKIVGYQQDQQSDWVAKLNCGHFQHVRHNPPWTNRPWVTTSAGRSNMLGHALDCKKCDQQAPLDFQTTFLP